MNGRLAALLLALGPVACLTPASGPSGPRLSARWTGADTVQFSGRAEAEWCDSLHMLEIRAASGDTGVGIALYPTDTLHAGAYRVVLPDAAATAPPPSAAIGLRWFAKTSVLGFRGDSGELALERRPDGSLAGRFTAAARALVGNGRVHVTGSFDALRPTRAAATCAGQGSPAATPPDNAGGEEQGPEHTD